MSTLWTERCSRARANAVPTRCKAGYLHWFLPSPPGSIFECSLRSLGWRRFPLYFKKAGRRAKHDMSGKKVFRSCEARRADQLRQTCATIGSFSAGRQGKSIKERDLHDCLGSQLANNPISLPRRLTDNHAQTGNRASVRTCTSLEILAPLSDSINCRESPLHSLTLDFPKRAL